MTETEYLKPGEQTAGIRDLILFYNGHYESNAGVWKKEEFVPYISYVDRNGVPQEWLFNGALFLAKWSQNFNGYEESHDRPSNKEDWQWILEKTFESDLPALNEAVGETARLLGDEGYQFKVVLMIPYPAPNQKEFGSLDGERVLLFDHSVVSPEEAQRNKKAAVQWYVDQLMERWDKKDLPHLKLAGLYWMNEAVNQQVPGEEELIGWTGGLVHKLGLKYFWIPYFNAAMYWKWKELGFDAAALQPNHFFSNTTAERVKVAADMARQAGMGVEIEVDSRVFDLNGGFRPKYPNYLNGGLEYGYAGDVFRGYYQDVKLLAQAAYSSDASNREVYEWTYQFIKGGYSHEQ